MAGIRSCSELPPLGRLVYPTCESVRLCVGVGAAGPHPPTTPPPPMASLLPYPPAFALFFCLVFVIPLLAPHTPLPRIVLLSQLSSTFHLLYLVSSSPCLCFHFIPIPLFSLCSPLIKSLFPLQCFLSSLFSFSLRASAPPGPSLFLLLLLSCHPPPLLLPPSLPPSPVTPMLFLALPSPIRP